MTTRKCEYITCTNRARFYVNQATIPQMLMSGHLMTGEYETSPAGRNNLSCGKHLSRYVGYLGTLSFRISTQPVKVTIL